MKFPAFAYARPRSMDEALARLHDGGADVRILAGGQSLLPLLAMRLTEPSLIVDIGTLDSLDAVGVANGRVRIGALVRHARIERDETLARAAPLLAEAASHIAHPSIRNRGTLGGSLAHADPAAELPACAVALDARIHLHSATGVREVAAEDFFWAPL